MNIDQQIEFLEKEIVSLKDLEEAHFWVKEIESFYEILKTLKEVKNGNIFDAYDLGYVQGFEDFQEGKHDTYQDIKRQKEGK